MKTRKVVRMPLRRPPQQPRQAPVTKLRARAATAEEVYDEEDYEGYEEPNMKFSHAVIVVLILHFIAVGAIFAFNSIKAQQTAEQKSAQTSPAPEPETAASTDATAPENAASASTASAAAMANSAPASNEKTYTVQAGDTLTRIAALNDVSVAAIREANGLDSVAMLHVGQILKMPGEGKATPKVVQPTAAEVKSTAAAHPAATDKTTATAKPAAGSEGTYTVAKGDNPYSIAKKLHVSYNELLTVNGIKDPTKIQIGQKLKLPAKKN